MVPLVQRLLTTANSRGFKTVKPMFSKQPGEGKDSGKSLFCRSMSCNRECCNVEKMSVKGEGVALTNSQLLATLAFLTMSEKRQKSKMVRTLPSLPGRSPWLHPQMKPGWGVLSSGEKWPQQALLVELATSHAFLACPPQVSKHAFTITMYLLDSHASCLMEAPLTYISHFVGLFSNYWIFRVFKNICGCNLLSDRSLANIFSHSMAHSSFS